MEVVLRDDGASTLGHPVLQAGHERKGDEKQDLSLVIVLNDSEQSIISYFSA